MSRFFGHLRTITKHRHMTMRHCFKAGIPWRGLMHDLSKYSPTEFIPGVRYYSGNHSPTADERAVEGSSKAWMHHKGRNRHHYEYWTDFSLTERRYVPVEMPLVFAVEMFCDRIAASKVYQKDRYTDRSPLEYYLRRKSEETMHPKTAELLEMMLTMLADKGEKETFRYIRKELVGKNRKKKEPSLST